MQEFEEDYYAILGVEESATQEEIRKAYLNLAKKLHPDRFPNDPEKRAVAQSEFAKVTRAHDLISDSEKRAEYDAVRLLARKRAQLQNQNAANGEAPRNEVLFQTLSQTLGGQAAVTGEEENINVKWANKHLERADEFFRKKNYKDAESAMKEAIRLVPTEPRYHNKLAEIYIARGWRTLAMTEVQASLRTEPRNAEAKSLEAKIKVLNRNKTVSGQSAKGGRKSFFQQLKEILTKKL